jgi:D-alanyl-D-alanine carboxypeptidase
MTRRAEEIGCENTIFSTPHGLPAQNHHTTAWDLALITREALKNPVFREIVSTQRATLPWVGHEYDRVLTNKNKLLSSYPGAIGVKTGYTKAAGRCLVFSAERDSLSLIGAVLNCPTWFDTATAMLDYGFENFRSEVALQGGQRIDTVPVTGGVSSSVDIVADAPLRTAVPIGQSVTVARHLPKQIEAPVRAGQPVGTAQLIVNGQALAECRLIAASDVPRRDLRASIIRLLRGWILSFQA